MLTSTRREVAKLTRRRPEPTKEKPVPGEGLDPATALCLAPDRIRKTTELHWGQRGLTAIHPNIQKFTNLESLWINDNNLSRIAGLLPDDAALDGYAANPAARGTRRLKQLYASNNRLETLRGDVEKLSYLEVLILGKNQLRNMEAVCQTLSQLKSLTHLDLLDNPLAEEAEYRHYVIFHLRSLTLFDRHLVTDAERNHAAMLFGPKANTTTGYSFGSTAPHTCNPTLIDHLDKKWRRVWHQTDGPKGVFDVRPAIVMEVAARATQVHIRTAGRPSISVTSNPDAFPLHRLRAGRCLSCRADGRPATRRDVDDAWTGSPHLKMALACSAVGPASEFDRPISRVLYKAFGNKDGLRIVHSDVGDSAECAWGTAAAVDPIEIYVDIEWDGAVQDVSTSVRHLQSEVVKIRRETAQKELQGKTAHSRSREGLRSKQTMFHDTWQRRLGVSDASWRKTADAESEESARKAVAAALRTLKLPADAASVAQAREEMHKHEAPVSCLFSAAPGRRCYTDSEPFVPDRDADCYSACYATYLQGTHAARQNEEHEAALSLCFTPAEINTLVATLGSTDLGTASVTAAGVPGVVQLCMPGRAGSVAEVSQAALAALAEAPSDDDAGGLPLRAVLCALARCPAFVEYKVECARREAAALLKEDKVSEAAAKHGKMNRLRDLIAASATATATAAGAGGRRGAAASSVGAAIRKHALPERVGTAASAAGSAVGGSGGGGGGGGLARPGGSAGKRAGIAEEGAPPPRPARCLPPSGANPNLGRVGDGVLAVGHKRLQSEWKRAMLAAALAVASLAAVPLPKARSLPPWN